MSETLVRLQKYIADCGVTSRRKAEEMIVCGQVTINNQVVTELGTKVNPQEDVVHVDGKLIDLGAVEKVYIVLNKPRAYVTTLNDPEGRPTVMDLCKEVPERVYPVGRLDYLSEGLLVLTNDGELANKIMHPSNNIIKVYEVKVFGIVGMQLLNKLKNGVQTDEGFLRPHSVRVVEQLPNKTWLEFRLGEGRNREIRRLCEACGITVEKLRRVAIGGLTINNLAPGRFMYYSKKQISDLIGVGKRPTTPTYVSSKKSISVPGSVPKNSPKADDRKFVRYRKENYYQTMNSYKVLNEKKESERQSALQRIKPVDTKE
ncbi:MAG: hypothetical protein A2504_13475 [Bdellovibrionales bacterium RIFOXYD12_FULL_39_22]|nr:MAG: hypothetical protein A2385_01275 [Bdellovibrionales bacterium RIFOXYB1_FULL_39_21]OFZ43637.1 MAG: hypothetical protein A2485_12945 [Bdellovibrionales bacterium RIFOXYC12_FULL_39_17]OFZ44656.1 MAG: hypothetical protein A2404_10635 [Bdellovibrionales bacterium RIFOXYC1_FULL_39_130]OFZ76415.1 MAG: hypothetical protein A2560_07255 [Bdellovibrionales bacterium RIFOXYD1_FULL_39_84]OFZ94681.1 MAG: hypothetical protein A2504_13475 [Bdellovibrionales bacterium RIFOXYD12_FULL_39_22]HLE12861.1 ps